MMYLRLCKWELPRVIEDPCGSLAADPYTCSRFCKPVQWFLL